MPRNVLPENRIHPSIRQKIAEYNHDIVAEVEAAAAKHRVLVVGMAQNPYPRKAKKYLTEAGIAFEYLEYGNYMSLWRKRSALKMWTGWPTFPMIFVDGVLIGGADDVKALIDAGELKR